MKSVTYQYIKLVHSRKKALPCLYFMQVVNGLREIINIVNGKLSFDINTKCKSDDDGVSANTVMWMLYILWLSDIGRSDFSKVRKYRLQ